MSASDFSLQRIAAPLGATVEGLDLRTMDDETWLTIDQLFCQHKFLVFPEQQLTPQDHMEFARRWGKLVRHPYAGLDEYPEIIELVNVGKKRDINQHWHSDMTYNEAPPKLTMLYALETPEIGGDTAFANQELAYQSLSDGVRKTIDSLTAIHSAAGLARTYGETAEDAPEAQHPVVRTHDQTGNRSLYVCRAFTRQFCGWNPDESQALLDFLFEHSCRPEFQARHVWSKNDLIMWDNRSVVHFAVHDHDDEPRCIHRLQVEGEVPQ